MFILGSLTKTDSEVKILENSEVKNKKDQMLIILWCHWRPKWPLNWPKIVTNWYKTLGNGGIDLKFYMCMFFRARKPIVR